MRVTTPLRFALMIGIGPFALLACGTEDSEVADEIVEATGNETQQAILIETENDPIWVGVPAFSLANDDDAQAVIRTRPDKSAKALLDDPVRFDLKTIRDGVVTPPTPEPGFDPGIWVPAPIDVLIDDEEDFEKEDEFPDKRVKDELDNPAWYCGLT